MAGFIALLVTTLVTCIGVVLLVVGIIANIRDGDGDGMAIWGGCMVFVSLLVGWPGAVTTEVLRSEYRPAHRLTVARTPGHVILEADNLYLVSDNLEDYNNWPKLETVWLRFNYNAYGYVVDKKIVFHKGE